MDKIKYTSIKDKKEFFSDGHKIKFLEYYPDTDVYVYGRYVDGELTSYEVVHPRYVRQDGERTPVYPSPNDWGRYGMTVWNSSHARKEIDFLVGTKDWSPENLHRFKQSL